MTVIERPRTSLRDLKTRSDYVSIAIAYAETAIEDRKGETHGVWIRLAAKRFIADLKRAQKTRTPFYFSAERGNDACWFIELLPHVEGVWGLATIKLDPFQVFFIVQLFGFRNLDGGRRFSTALFAIARKNAKSTLAAAVLLYCFCEEAEVGPQILSAATTGDQARIVWGIAKRMVEKTADLREQYGVEAFSNVIARYMNGGTFKPINAKASTQDGLNPSALCFDELHAHKTHDLVNVLKSAAGARKNPLFLYTTTEGYETPGPWPEERNFARQILSGVIEADHYLAIIYAVDDKDDDFDETRWVKANPLMLSNLGLADKIRENALEAKQKPGSLSEFRIKRLNRQSATATGFVHLPKWNKCAGKVPLDELVGSRCWGAFDLASTTDMAAWWLLWLKGETYYAWGRYWVPSEAVKQRTERKTISYQSWVDSGFVTMTDGDVTDYDIIERDILEDFLRFSPQSIAYDSWNATALANRLVTNGVTAATDKNPNGLQQFIQGPRSYNPAMNAFEKAYLAGNLCHGGNPVLTWNAANLVARTDVNMNKAPDKKKSADKIDGIVCLLMCFGLAAMQEQKRYQAFFV